MKQAALLIILALALLQQAPPAGADAPVAFADPNQARRYHALIAELRCLVCQNQSLADSNADLAQDLREEVQRMIGAGASDDAIVAFLVDRYGDFVLYRPPLKPLTYLLWFGPALLLVIGAVIAAHVVRRRSVMDAPILDADEQRLAERLLQGEGEEGRAS